MALMALGVEREDEIITVPFSFFATGASEAEAKKENASKGGRWVHEA